MINCVRLKDKLSGNIDGIINVLESIGFDRISTKNPKDLRFPRIGGHNPSSMSFNTERLQYYCFSTGEHGDIFSLVMNTLGCPFGEAVRTVAEKTGMKLSEFTSMSQFPFGGFYKYVEKEVNDPEENMTAIDESVLSEYRKNPNRMFIDDGIDAQTQEVFKDGYDILSNRITIPEYTFDGRLCGVMGRFNDKECDKEDRWFPLIPCQRSCTLYGYHVNYGFIQQKQTVIIGESEKFVQQMYSMGYRNALALCGDNVSDVQARYIKSMLCKRVVLALDEGLEEEFVRKQADKLLYKGNIWKSEIGYIYDKDNEILTKGGKESPSDKGKEALKDLCKDHIVWLNRE